MKAVEKSLPVFEAYIAGLPGPFGAGDARLVSPSFGVQPISEAVDASELLRIGRAFLFFTCVYSLAMTVVISSSSCEKRLADFFVSLFAFSLPEILFPNLASMIARPLSLVGTQL